MIWKDRLKRLSSPLIWMSPALYMMSIKIVRLPGSLEMVPTIMSIENLPCEIPIESSSGFSSVLKKLFLGMQYADFTKPLDQIGLPEEIKGAVIALNGKLTPKYEYIEKSLREHA